MKDNFTYHFIRRILKKASLKHDKSDWEKMNSLLDEHLPVSPGTGMPNSGPTAFYFTLSIYIGALSVVVATMLIVPHAKRKIVRNLPGTSLNRKVNQGATKFKTNPERVVNFKNFKENGIATDSARGTSSLSQAKGIVTKMIPQLEETKNSLTVNIHSRPHKIHSNMSFRYKDEPEPDAVLTALSKGMMNTKRISGKSMHDVGVIISKQGKDFQMEWKTGKLYSNPMTTVKISDADKMNKQPDSVDAKNNPTAKKRLASVKSHSFQYGLTLPFIQIYDAPGVQSVKVNYIPGITARYMFSKHMGLGINILPYQAVNVNSRDAVFMSSQLDSLNGLMKTKKYYVSGLNTFNAGLHLIYQMNQHLGFEIGLGYQHFYSGNGKVVEQDTLYLPGISQDIKYSKNDRASANIEKSNFNYYLNAVYSVKQWDILLGYQLNSKSWITTSPSKPVGCFNIAFRYYFSKPGKKDASTSGDALLEKRMFAPGR